MIVLFTDFGLEGPYTGQVKAVLYRTAPEVPVVDLFADAPIGRPKPAAYLLAAYGVWFPPGTVFLAVVDPGVGGPRAPVAGRLARGEHPAHTPRAPKIGRHADWPDDLPEIVYVDHYGNALTGLRGNLLPNGARLAVSGRVLMRARTFSDVPPGEAFWYENSNGLAEIAVNVGRAADALQLVIGSPVAVLR